MSLQSLGRLRRPGFYAAEYGRMSDLLAFLVADCRDRGLEN